MTNENRLDRTIRIVLGLVLLALTVLGPRSMLGLIGIVPLVTGIVGFCPLYRLVGINTCAIDRN
jgi:membrane protein implicated in regulation of membrane protease activity